MYGNAQGEKNVDEEVTAAAGEHSYCSRWEENVDLWNKGSWWISFWEMIENSVSYKDENKVVRTAHVERR
jgi:hypothetical protein